MILSRATMTNQDLPDDLQPGDKVGDVVLKDSDFDGATLRTRDVWNFLFQRSNYQLVLSPRTESPPDRGQSTMNISSRDTLQRDLERRTFRPRRKKKVKKK